MRDPEIRAKVCSLFAQLDTVGFVEGALHLFGPSKSWEMDGRRLWADTAHVGGLEQHSVQAGPTMAQIRRAAQGSSLDQRRVLEFVSPRVLGICRRVLGPSHPNVEDAMQDSLVGVVRGLDRLESADKLGAYAARVAVRTAIRVAKRTRKRKRDEAEVAHADLFDAGVSPRAELIAKRRVALIREILAELPSDQSEAIAAQVVLGLSLEEAAEQFGVPTNTIRSRVRLAKEKMRSMILKTPRYQELLE